MAILSKAYKRDIFKLHNPLKLSFTNIRHLCSNFVDCLSFLEPNSPDILSLCETNLDCSINYGNLFVRGYLPLIRQDSNTHMHVCIFSHFIWRRDFLLHRNYLSKTPSDSYLRFRLALLHSVSCFFFLYQSTSSSMFMVFDSISSNIDKVLLINPSANVFAFRDFNVHHKDWISYSGGTDRSGELCYLKWPYLKWLYSDG